ncbi:hypothetical protein [Tannerella forsythia]|uniref:hypothetical protein n=1 Tax=Tannerella forsythia TaxID=28112 RepID=UPI0028F07DBB|nr:hypothetical protein [Tannerella forsythia]
MPGTRYPNAEEHPPSPLQRGKSGSKALGKQANAEAFVNGPRAVSRRSSEQGERKSGCLKRSELPDFPTCKRREGV